MNNLAQYALTTRKYESDKLIHIQRRGIIQIQYVTIGTSIIALSLFIVNMGSYQSSNKPRMKNGKNHDRKTLWYSLKGDHVNCNKECIESVTHIHLCLEESAIQNCGFAATPVA